MATDLVQLLQSTWDKAPEEIRMSAPTVLAVGIQGINAITLTQDSLEPVHAIVRNLNPDIRCTEGAACTLLAQAQHNTTVVNNHEPLLCGLTSTNLKDVPHHVKDQLTKELTKTGNFILLSSIVVGFVQIVVTTVSLWNLNEVLGKAQNLTQRSKLTQADISKRLKNLPGKIVVLTEILDKLCQDKISDRKITQLSNQANRIRDAVYGELELILEDINSLKCEVDGVASELGSSRKQAFSAGIGSIANSIGGAINVGLLFGIAGQAALAITGAVAGINLILGIAALTKAHLTRQDFEDLQKQLNEIVVLRSEVNGLRTALQDQMNLIYNKIEELLDD